MRFRSRAWNGSAALRVGKGREGIGKDSYRTIPMVSVVEVVITGSGCYLGEPE